MAIPKIVGIETEFGIMVRGTTEWNPVSASSLLINAYVGSEIGSLDDRSAPVAWDFIDETPGIDARELAPDYAIPPEVETHLVNAVLTNGARYYVDHAHPELSTPECRDALSLVVYDRAAELILIESMKAAAEALPPGQEIVIYKDNSDRKGNAYGCHENYLLARGLPFGQIVTAATTHFITRQVFTGSGKVGSELPGVGRDQIPYQLTQRAEHFEEEVGLETTLKRPIVNTRDEPHADSQKYRRLHVIVGDANMSQTATLLKVGTSAILFAMLEDGAYDDPIVIDSPVSSMHAVSHDLTLRAPLRLAGGTTATAIEIQWQLLERARSWADRHGLEAVGEDCGKLVLERWEQVLAGLESDPDSVAHWVDWAAKHRLLRGFMERHDCQWDDSRLRALDLQYHDLRPTKSLAARAGLETIVDEADARAAITGPPEDTRAYFRGRCLEKFADNVVAANWDSIVFDIGDDPLRRVPMLEPGRGTRSHVGTILDESDTASELLHKLGA
ncbi:MAG: depupylase/deamidase Dop [Acidimicrobiia bacterium]|nr:depupylase/deamidase Dop [Acidimicrobiia bacterium]